MPAAEQAPQAAVIIMAKQPTPGRTKTRLCPPFSPQQAADFFEALLMDTITLVDGLQTVRLALAVSPPEDAVLDYFRRITPPGALLLPVAGANIGECLEQALRGLLAMGFERAIALNADGPSLPAEYLQQAVVALSAHDVVLGPGEDGGYYLVGLTKPRPEIFVDIPWSTGQVLARTLEQAARMGLSTALTPPWYDVDGPAEVARIRQEALAGDGLHLANTRRFFTQNPLLHNR